jgi:hypothetical protein
MNEFGFSLQWLATALGVYGSIFMNLAFVFAAGLLFAHFKNIFSGMFFFGLLIASISAIAIRLIFQFHLFDSADDMQRQVQLLSIVSGIGYFVQVIGFLLLVFHLIERKNAGNL